MPLARYRIGTICLRNTASVLREAWSWRTRAHDCPVRVSIDLGNRAIEASELRPGEDQTTTSGSTGHRTSCPDPAVEPVVAEKSTNSERSEPLDLIPTGTERSSEPDQRPERKGSSESKLRLRSPWKVFLAVGN